MASGFPIKLGWLLFLAFIFSQKTIWENAEDFINIHFEPEEDFTSNYFQRIRVVPVDNNENWQQKLQWENNYFHFGWRIDKPSYSESIQNSKAFAATRIKGNQIILGNTRIQTGNSLLFGSDYPLIKSPYSLGSLAKLRWKISPYLGSKISSNPKGLFLLRDNEKIGFFTGYEKSNLYSGFRSQTKNQTVVVSGFFPKNDSYSVSISYQYVIDYFNISGESAFHSRRFAQYIQLFSNDSDMNWLSQFRYLPPAWETVTGIPSTGSGKSSNETGIFISIKKRINKNLLFGWVDIYQEIQPEENSPKESGQDLLGGFRFRWLPLGSIELQTRNKTNLNLVKSGNLSKLQKKMKTYYTITAKNILIWKWKTIQVLPQKEAGWLFQVQSLKLRFNNWSTFFGTVYYHTSSWESRLYIIEPGLKGEFRIQPYYLRGVSLYSKLNWKINKYNTFSIRFSIQTNLDKSVQIEPEMGAQLDIVF